MTRRAFPDGPSAVITPVAMTKRIVVVGSSNTDMIVQMPRIPGPGETILGGTFSMAAGGKGANQAVAAARAGGDVVLVARVGEDLFGEKALEGFARDGIDIRCIVRDGTTPSGVALIFVGNSGENCIAVAPGANARLSAADIEQFRDLIESAGILVLQLETPMESVQTAVEIAARRNIPVILNPAPAAPVPPEVLQLVDILTPNEHEAKVLAGVDVSDEDAAGRAAHILMGRGVKTVVITMGARGAFVASGEIHERIPGYPVKAVDTTGAGDVFNGALAAALVEGRPLRAAVFFANAAAALSVTRLGAQPSIPTRHEIEGFVSQQTTNVQERWSR